MHYLCAKMRVLQRTNCHECYIESQKSKKENGNPYIIAVDLNINRIIRLLKRLKSYDANLVPRICCLPFQKKTIYKLLKFYDMQKTRILTIDNESVMNIFAEIRTNCCKKEAYITMEGKNVDANIQKSERKDNEENRITPLRFHHLPRGVVGCY